MWTASLICAWRRTSLPISIWARLRSGTTPGWPRTIRASSCPRWTFFVVHRSDGSGTTYIFTDYLSKVSKDWAGGPGKGAAPSWPRGIGAKGNEGVAGFVRQSPGSIGYVELIYAMQNKIPFAYVRSAGGTWLKASIEGVTEAAASLKNMPADYRVSITNAPAKNAYPISSFTWLLIPNPAKDPTNGKVLIDFLKWMLQHENEASALYYAPLPAAVAQQVSATINTLK
jgi:phosphate transport system substrate-binding protein